MKKNLILKHKVGEKIVNLPIPGLECSHMEVKNGWVYYFGKRVRKEIMKKASWENEFDKKFMIINKETQTKHIAPNVAICEILDFVFEQISLAKKEGKASELTRCIVRLLHIPNGDKETLKAIRGDFVARLEELESKK